MPTLLRAEIAALANTHFGDLGKQHVAIAVAVALAESAGQVDAINDNYPRWQTEDSVYRWDYGLMQINSVHGYDQNRLITDADYNMRCARQIWNGQGWDAWTTFKWGLYLNHYEAPAADEVPPMDLIPNGLEIAKAYMAVTDAYYPAYDSNDTRFFPVKYIQDGDRRYAVYELWLQA